MSDHWYHVDGTAAHVQPSADGKRMVPTTLTHARRLRLLPSVTTILNVIDKPQLTAWRVRNALRYAYQTPPDAGEGADAYVARVEALATAQTTTAAADEGSRIHAAIEASFKGEDYDPQYRPHVEAVYRELALKFPADDWVAESRVVSVTHGYAGTCDLHSRHANVVLDFKCKDFVTLDKRMAFDQHRQLAAYAHALDMHDATLVNVFVSRTKAGLVMINEWNTDAFEDGWSVFSAAAALWRTIKRYDPRGREDL